MQAETRRIEEAFIQKVMSITGASHDQVVRAIPAKGRLTDRLARIYNSLERDLKAPLTDEQQALRDAVRGAVQRDASFAAIRAWVLEGDVDTAPAWELAANQGWTGIGVAEEAGGQGGGVLEASILAEELGRGGVPADALVLQQVPQKKPQATTLGDQGKAAGPHRV